MDQLKCPYDDIKKDYIIPTKSWLKAIEEFNPNDYYIKGKIILAELLEKHKVLVKVTSGKSAKLRDINSKIKGLPNMVYTYCVILCNDYLPVILNTKQFCSLNDQKYKATLEIMKLYNGGSLNNKNVDLIMFKNILEQIVLGQINLFVKTGLTHCDIHPGNILMHKNSNEIELIYGYLPLNLNNPVIIKSQYEFILSDYDKCVDFSPIGIGSSYIIEPDGTVLNFNVDSIIEDIFESILYKNINRTLAVLLEKLESNDKQKIKDNYMHFHNQYDKKIIKKEKKYLEKYIGNMNKNPDNKINDYIKYKKKVGKLNQTYWNLLSQLF